MNSKHTGALSEIKAQAWLLAQGYEVFENVSQHGDYDLIILNPASKRMEPIDVTTGYRYLKQDGSSVVHFAKGKLKKDYAILVVVDDEYHWYNR